MAKSGLLSRRIRRQIQNKPALAVIILFLIFALVTLFNIDSTPLAQFTHIDIDIDIDIGIPIPNSTFKGSVVDWTRRAYVQYVTSPEEVCKAVMLFSELDETSSLALRVLYYPNTWRLGNNKDAEPQFKSIARLLKEASTEFSVVLQPMHILSTNDQSHTILAGQFRNLLAFNLTQYDRVVVLDKDSIVSDSMDELFLLPPTPIALPWVYWHETSTWSLSSKLMAIQPSISDFKKVEKAIESSSTKTRHEDLILKVFKSRLLKLPQRAYHFLSSEFHQPIHTSYLEKDETWKPDEVWRDTKFTILWDPPLERPWEIAVKDLQDKLPQCGPQLMRKPGIDRFRPRRDCRNRNAWSKLYSDFRNRRRIVCGEGFL